MADDSIVDDPLIHVEDGRIVTVTRRPALSIGSPDLLDLGDVTVLPGLIDIHQHLAFDASADPVTHLTDIGHPVVADARCRLAGAGRRGDHDP